MSVRIRVDESRLASLCRKWKVRELAVFGSALRDDFGPHSDVDVLVTFSAEAEWSLLDHIRMEEELGELVGRKVDLVTRRSVEQSSNWIRRENILDSAEPIYVAG